MKRKQLPSVNKSRSTILLVVAVVLVVLAALGTGSYTNAAAMVEETKWVAHAQEVLDQLQDAFSLVLSAETGERGYLITADPDFLQPYNAAVRSWPMILSTIREGTGRSLVEQAELEALAQAIDIRLQQMADTIEVFRTQGRAAAEERLEQRRGFPVMESIRSLVGALRDQEARAMAQRLASGRARALDSSRLILLLSILVVISGVVGLIFLRRAEDHRARAYSQLRGIIEGSSDGVVAVDKNYRLVVFNAAFIQYHQTFNQITPKVGDPLSTLMQRVDAITKTYVLNLFQRALTGAEFRVIFERQDDHGMRYYDWHFSPIRNDAGKLVGTAHIFRDVTHNRNAELQVADYALRLEASNRELTDFAFVASHDLQEPLRKILAFGERVKVLEKDHLTAEGLDHLQRMQNAAQRMQRLIQDLLGYSRVTTKGRPPEPIDLNHVLREVVSDLHLRIQETGATIEAPEFPPAQGDPTQMRQLFENLVGNALKYHRTGVPPVIRITLDPGPGGPVVSVRDNGIGFDPQYSERIFEIFQRLHGQGEFEGTGVGLAICRKIVVRHGGTIVAEGRPGEGAVFRITFPEEFWTSRPRRPS